MRSFLSAEERRASYILDTLGTWEALTKHFVPVMAERKFYSKNLGFVAVVDGIFLAITPEIIELDEYTPSFYEDPENLRYDIVDYKTDRKLNTYEYINGKKIETDGLKSTAKRQLKRYVVTLNDLGVVTWDKVWRVRNLYPNIDDGVGGKSFDIRSMPIVYGDIKRTINDIEKKRLQIHNCIKTGIWKRKCDSGSQWDLNFCKNYCGLWDLICKNK